MLLNYYNRLADGIQKKTVDNWFFFSNYSTIGKSIPPQKSNTTMNRGVRLWTSMTSVI